MSQTSIWSPINQQDFWLPCVFHTGKELRLGALSSVHGSNQSIRFQTLHHSKDHRAVQVCQEQDCRPTQGWNGLQDHHQAAW